jgi:hypothetical protein
MFTEKLFKKMIESVLERAEKKLEKIMAESENLVNDAEKRNEMVEKIQKKYSTEK